ncbi:hypothetical protein AcV7_008365 [Taiwanofungus camphoratus]|nr:hypothetical protein AcV7_008365 [Antrodia cinnamomea]
MSETLASRPRTSSSVDTVTDPQNRVQEAGDVEKVQCPNVGGEGESAIPEDKKEEPLEEAEDDWIHDPVNPRNWRPGKKWRTIGIVAFYTFVSPLSSSMMAPALPQIAEHFGIKSQTETALTLSIFLLTFALGPLVLAPLSEMYGRTWVLHIGNLFMLAFNIGCAFAPTAGALIGFRLLTGFAASAPIACGGGSVSDLFSERDRAGAMALFTLGPIIGPVVGPIAGGFIAQYAGYKYIFIVIAGLAGLAAIVGIPFLRETYHPVVRLRRDKHAADPELAAKMHPHLLQGHSNKLDRMWTDLSRPFILLTRSYVCFLLSLYMALIYGIYYLMFATFPDLFSKVYHFSTGIGGLAYIGLGVGFVSATILGASIADKIYLTLAERNGGVGKPEMRIPALIFGSLFVPIGLFWYGWSAQAHIHWIMPMIGSGIFGFGMMTVL